MRRDYGQYVGELVSEGAGRSNYRIGLVVKSGAKQYEVLWESGFRQRYPQGYAIKVMDWTGWSDEERRAIQERIARYL